VSWGWPLASDGTLIVTTDAVGPASMVNGFCRRISDGALCVDTTLAGATWQAGFLRTPARKLVYGPGSAASYEHGGFARDANNALACFVGDPDIQYSGGSGGTDDRHQHGLKFDSTGRVAVTVVA
jgi:hypothetical protein